MKKITARHLISATYCTEDYVQSMHIWYMIPILIIQLKYAKIFWNIMSIASSNPIITKLQN
jgi:hypothetical protein